MAQMLSSGKGVRAYKVSMCAAKKPIKGALTNCTKLVKMVANKTSSTIHTSHFKTPTKKPMKGFIKPKKPSNCHPAVKACIHSTIQPLVQYQAPANNKLLARMGSTNQARTRFCFATLKPKAKKPNPCWMERNIAHLLFCCWCSQLF